MAAEPVGEQDAHVVRGVDSPCGSLCPALSQARHAAAMARHSHDEKGFAKC
jgi:hypothetical protein